jgi:hypothetical protein
VSVNGSHATTSEQQERENFNRAFSFQSPFPVSGSLQILRLQARLFIQ